VAFHLISDAEETLMAAKKLLVEWLFFSSQSSVMFNTDQCLKTVLLL
jgi:hypothetical protein